MAKSKYFNKKKDEQLPEGILTVEEALSVASKEETPAPVKVEAVESKSKSQDTPSTKVRQAYDVFFDKTDLSYKIVVIHYNDSNHSNIIKTELMKLDRNQAKAASTIQKVFSMKFLKRT